jgi:hypothetical protein
MTGSHFPFLLVLRNLMREGPMLSRAYRSAQVVIIPAGILDLASCCMMGVSAVSFGVLGPIELAGI